MTHSTDHYTAQTAARTDVAAKLKAEHLAAATAAGLTAEDLDALVRAGTAARDADREQHEQLASLDVARAGRKLTARDIFHREVLLRARLLAVVGDLAGTNPELSGWLSAVSFARYRLRELAVQGAGAAPAAQADGKKFERATREDILTRLAGVAGFCTALLAAGREPIVAAFAARGMARDAIESLGHDADALAREGRNVKHSPEATAREATAVRAQSDVWKRVRRMVRIAVADIPELKARFADA